MSIVNELTDTCEHLRGLLNDANDTIERLTEQLEESERTKEKAQSGMAELEEQHEEQENHLGDMEHALEVIKDRGVVHADYCSHYFHGHCSCLPPEVAGFINR